MEEAVVRVVREVWLGEGGLGDARVGEAGAGGEAGEGGVASCEMAASILVSHSWRALGSFTLPRSGLGECRLRGCLAGSCTSGRAVVVLGEAEAADLLLEARELRGSCDCVVDCAARRSSATICEARGTPSLPLQADPFLSGEAAWWRRAAGESDVRVLWRRESVASLLGEGCPLLSVTTLWDTATLRPSAVILCAEGDLREEEVDLRVEEAFLRGLGLALRVAGLVPRGAGLLRVDGLLPRRAGLLRVAGLVPRGAGLLLRGAGLVLRVNGLVPRGAGLFLRGAGLVLRVAGLVTRAEEAVLCVAGLGLRAGERRLGWSLRVGLGGSVS